ncbi:MAG: Rpn family recombination-promoting nuclease/putative transposase [Phormidesmis sp. CAN_BIN44]|nr:Rpn family recombination-promoting nuclease/putative transposase [Phormidesmis sp. CAN_BIN44]
MKTDSIFYQLFQAAPSAFFELIGNSDPRTSTYGFGSQEVKQASFTIDGIFIPPLRMRQAPIYFVEAQAYKEEENFYYRFFGEIHLYLKDYKPDHDWRAVVIFTEKRFDPGIPGHYSEYENNSRVQRIYLNKLPSDVSDQSLGLGILKLIGTPQKQAPERGRALIDRTRQEITDEIVQRNFIELVETIFVYKFPKLNSQEIGKMLGLTELKQTRVYQEAQEEKQAEMLTKMVPKLLRRGMTIEEIAADLELPVDIIQPFVPQS